MTAANKTPEGAIDIHGKAYFPVSYRVGQFRKDHPDYAIQSSMKRVSDDVVIVRARISDTAGHVLATGWAEEQRSNRGINATSALENAETSAVGRALAFLGYGSGGEIASADEVAAATSQQAVNESMKPLLDHLTLVRAVWPSVAAIKASIASGEYQYGMEAWVELSDDEKRTLWRAPSKGGIFTTKERECIRSAEFREAFQSESDE